MKISNVEHRKVSVSRRKANERIKNKKNRKKEEDIIKGQLYSYPNSDQCVKGTEEAVRHVIRQIKEGGLYSIFSPCPEDANEQEKFAYGKIEGNAKEIVGLLAARYDNIEVERRLDVKVNAIKKKHFCDVNRVEESSAAEDFVNYCVDNCLKTSLRKVIYVKQNDGNGIKYYLPDLIKELLMITCVKCNDDVYSQKIKAYQNDKLVLTVKCLDEDVNKTKQSKQIAASIDSQDVKVQVLSNGNGKILKLSGAEKKHAPLFRFMASYSAADIQNKNLMLAKLRGYITLFITGSSTYEEEAEIIKHYKNTDGKRIVPRIQYIAELPEHSVDFSQEADNIISELYQLEAGKDKAAEDKPFKEKSKASLRNAYMKAVKNQLCENFRKVKTKLENDGDLDGKYWVTYICDEAEKILCGKNINNKKIGQAYLITSIWKDMVAYIGTKYIDMGKAVYHFAMPENMMDLENNNVFGEVRKEYEAGITSFDYEMIKASEMIQRDVAVYLTFAVNNFARNTVILGYRDKEGNEDILTKRIKEKKEEEKIENKKNEENESITENQLYKDMKRRYLQFFGGQSKWEHSDVKQDTTKMTDLFEITKDLLYNLRNENFHYTGKRTEAFKNIDIIQKMFEYEISKSGTVLQKKYCSNNVLMFYTEKNVTSLMDSLYNGPKYIPAQIPSFANILSRKNVEQFLEGYVDKDKIGSLTHEELLKYHNSIYFVLKEIYYYGFLQQDDLAERFKAAMAAYEENHDEKWNWEAYRHFMGRVDEILQNKAASTAFHELCQRLITDFEQQNHNYKVRTSKTSEKDIYQHYKMLLYLGIRNAFKKYLESTECTEVYKFLKEPLHNNKVEFSSEWKGCRLYNGLSELKNDSYLLSWYVAAHFTDAKQVNHLMGDFKKHISFTEDIIRRREFLTGKQMDETVLASLARKNDQYKQIVSMLEFVQGQTNVFSNTIEDYFASEDEYENVLANYIDFGNSTLDAFCNMNVSKGSPTGTVGLFYDQKKRILNRNVVMASMFGSHDILAPNIKKITYGEICDYYAQMDALKEVFERNYCKTEKELIALRAYQNEKNRVELTDILIYSEIVNECLAKLIGWTYLRERDLMYLQLGMQYVRLYHTENVGKEENWTRKLSAKGVSIKDGAVLYEIAAMNDYNMSFYYKKGKNGETVGRMTAITSTKVMPFVRTYGEDVYAAGLEFFEKYHKDHDDVVWFRNYIDHFKYFATTKRSILDLYSDAYDRLFDYSPNFRKSVIYVLENILLRYFAIGHIRVTQAENAYCYETPPIARKAARLELKPFKDTFLVSDKMTFSYKEEDRKTGEDKKVNVAVYARSKLFMKQLAAILQYHK